MYNIRSVHANFIKCKVIAYRSPRFICSMYPTEMVNFETSMCHKWIFSFAFTISFLKTINQNWHCSFIRWPFSGVHCSFYHGKYELHWFHGYSLGSPWFRINQRQYTVGYTSMTLDIFLQREKRYTAQSSSLSMVQSNNISITSNHHRLSALT